MDLGGVNGPFTDDLLSFYDAGIHEEMLVGLLHNCLHLTER